MMVRLDLQALRTGRAGCERARFEHGLVVVEGAWGGAVHLEVADVLVQGPAEGHVQQLHAATDAENGDVPLDGCTCERDLEAVAIRVRELRLRTALGAVARG